MNLTKEKSNPLLGFIVFLISPIVAVLFSLKNYNQSTTKNIIWLFTVFFAYHILIPNEGVDINAYLARFARYSDANYELIDFITNLYAENSKTLDVFEPLISYLTSKVTSNGRVLLVIYGIIYGYFFSRNVSFFLEKLTSGLKPAIIPLIFLLFIVIGIWNINGFRFWCASHIFIYGLIQFIYYKKNKGVWFLIWACLCHLGLFVPVLTTIFFKFIRKVPISFFLGLYFLTLFLIELNLDSLRGLIADYGPNFMSNKLNSYTSEAYIEVLSDKYSSYSGFYHISKVFRIIINVFLVIYLFLNMKKLKHILFFDFFSYVLFFSAIANLLSQAPSGGRYLLISDFILYGIAIVCYQNINKTQLATIMPLVSALILLYAMYQFQSLGMLFFSIHHFINNPIVSLFIY